MQGNGKLSIYPNPVDRELHIAGLTGEAARYRIMDVTGRLLQRGDVHGSVIETDALGPGLFLLLVEQGGNTQRMVFVRR
jgi:hypothetical protein